MTVGQKPEKRCILLSAQQWHNLNDEQARRLLKALVDAGCWYVEGRDDL